MPTAAKLIAALLWAVLAWYTSQLIKPLFPEGTDVGWFAEVNALIGIVIGWQVAGSRAGGTWAAAISYGVTATVALVLWCLFLHSFAEMIRLSLRKLYEGPVDALVGVFALMVDYGQMILDPQVIVTLLVGGIIAGILTEMAGRNWR
jgi:hypothetical protein